MAAADAQQPTVAENGAASKDPGFEQALSEVQHALEQQHVTYIDTTPLIAALLTGPLAVEQVGDVAGLDPSQVHTGLQRLEDLGMVSHARAGGRELISLTSAGIAAAG
ncbi:MAG: hypothetical protein ACLP1Q_12575 [Solirubrobacteraceae bacterium]